MQPSRPHRDEGRQSISLRGLGGTTLEDSHASHGCSFVFDVFITTCPACDKGKHDVLHAALHRSDCAKPLHQSTPKRNNIDNFE